MKQVRGPDTFQFVLFSARATEIFEYVATAFEGMPAQSEEESPRVDEV
jgi:hypothetical protein